MTLDVLESITVPLIFKATVGVSALEVTVIVFRIGFTILVSYLTSISPLSPAFQKAQSVLDFNNMTINEVRAIYGHVKTTCNNLTIKYLKEIITPIVTDLVS